MKITRFKTWTVPLLMGLCLAGSVALLAADPAPAASSVPAVTFTQADKDAIANYKIGLDTVWVLLTAALVFFMNLGFALVESGFCRAKNCVNILSKNFIVFAASALAYYVIGWGLMFGNGSGFMGSEGLFMLGGADNSPATGADYKGAYNAINWTGIPFLAKFFFQLVFAGTAATIVSGAVAERIKYGSFIIFTFLLVGIMYPITGHWIWGGGFLALGGFFDFAGSTVVHSVGGWAALAGILVLGPRIGKYGANGQVNPVPGHNLTAAVTGCFVLWLGWFGFNPGSTMAVIPADISLIFVTTNSGAIMALLTSTVASWMIDGKPSLGMAVNGCLAGLVAVTASCAFISVGSSMIIGSVAGVLVVLAVKFFDKMKIDDPVGALAVHLCNGVFGTLCVGLFADNALTGKGLFIDGSTKLLFAQIKGIVVVGVFTFVLALIGWLIVKALFGMRVSAKEEEEGLDIGEHGEVAYAGFSMESEGKRK